MNDTSPGSGRAPLRRDRASLRSHTDEQFVRSPRVTHTPQAEPVETKMRVPRTPRQRIAAIGATLSVAGLGLVAAMPMAAQAETAESAAAVQQELFSEVSTDALPASFIDIVGVASNEVSAASFVFDPDMLVNYPFAQSVMLTDTFGYRTAPVEQFHDAQDFAAAAGTSIKVIADGVVTEAGQTSDGCGFGLKVEHQLDGHTVTSRYCHMVDNSHEWQVDDTVKMGQEAGQVGATGMAFGAHLHLAIRVDDKPVDPVPFLAKYGSMKKANHPSSANAKSAEPVTAAE